MAASQRPASVVWLYAPEDSSMAYELLRFARVLERQGLITNWSTGDIPPGHEWAAEIRRRVADADILMLLVSADALASGVFERNGAFGRIGSARVIPVILRPVARLPPLDTLQSLPRSGHPISTWSDRDAAYLDVVSGLQEVVAFRSSPPSAVPIAAAPPAEDALTINDIFRLDGPPRYTFVEPPEFNVLKLELRTMGTGLIVEGPSKAGKSTAVKKALEAIGVPASQQIWWLGQDPPSLAQFKEQLDALLTATKNTWLFIDDFHYLEDESYRRILAFRMKALADRDERHAKVTLIGINPLGSSLAQVMPDLAGRFRVFPIDRDTDWTRSTRIAELIISGERAANIRFKRRDEFVLAAAGSFFIAQLLCNRAAVQAGVTEAQPSTAVIDVGPADVVSRIQAELAARFREPLLEFAAFDESPPPRGAGLSLLWLLSRSPEGFVSIKQAKLRFPALAAAFDWLLKSNLTRCFTEHPRLKGLLYFNRSSWTLTMEDPQLKFYLRELDWQQFAEASGHGAVRFHPEDGPIWPMNYRVTPAGGVRVTGSVSPSVTHEQAAAGGRDATPPAAAERIVLHLSDLHFGTTDEATLYYAQLAADLREQGFDRLCALIVSGDIANRADVEEYNAARLFLEQLMAGFGLSPRQVVLVPGNHDLSWTLSDAAYTPIKRARYAGALKPGTYKEHGPEIIEIREETAYRERFRPFSDFYRQIKGDPYPVDEAEQSVLIDIPDCSLTILGLNSAWEIDHHFPNRASIHMGAFSRALLQLTSLPADRLRIAVFHHPLGGDDNARIRDTSFLQQLAVHGFRLVLHGHVHKADSSLYRYDMSTGGRRIEIITAGTFGAPTREWVPGYPLQYNVLRVRERDVVVETRCRRELNGAWEPDARWRMGPNQSPSPRYTIDLG